MGAKIHNNKGVSHGSPVSAGLYITFDDGIRGEYKNELSMTNAENAKWQ